MRTGKKRFRSSAVQKIIKSAAGELGSEAIIDQPEEVGLYPKLKIPLEYNVKTDEQRELVSISKMLLKTALNSNFYRLYRKSDSDAYLLADMQTEATEWASYLVKKNLARFPCELRTTFPPARKRKKGNASEALTVISSKAEGKEEEEKDEEEKEDGSEEEQAEDIDEIESDIPNPSESDGDLSDEGPVI